MPEKGLAIEKTAKSSKKLASSFGGFIHRFRRTATRHGFVLLNIGMVIGVTMVVWSGHNSATKPTSQSLFSAWGENQSGVPLDTISSADIAANIAIAASLPEAVTVSNQADSYNAQLLSVKVDQAIVAKPQLVTGGAKSRKDIITYTAQSGDTAATLAAKYGVSSDSIRWSNGLGSDYIQPGKELLIPPQNGIVYKVKTDDTVDALASKFQAKKEQIIAFNDIELSGLPVDEYILIPNGVQPVVVYSIANNGDSSAIYGYVPQWGGNGYTYGYCTYYVATRVSVPRNWGNANTWDDYARLSGWTVSSTPVVGAIAQADFMSYWGHVAYVEEVSVDGTMMRYSDMNALAGWNRVGYSDWVPISTYQNYIYH